jgi:hypothetical protein
VDDGACDVQMFRRPSGSGPDGEVSIYPAKCVPR